MKKRILIICGLIMMIAAITTYFSTTSNVESLAIQNIEALAAGEHVGGMIECTGTGGIYCPVNKKADYNSVIIYQ